MWGTGLQDRCGARAWLHNDLGCEQKIVIGLIEDLIDQSATSEIAGKKHWNRARAHQAAFHFPDIVIH